MAVAEAAAGIGCRISLTTKSGMRYEGSMLHVDAQECTIALQNVKSFGTEGRRPVFVVAPSDKIYNHVVFYSSDITELCFISPPSVPSQLIDDPAIIESRDSLPPARHTGLSSPGHLTPNHGGLSLRPKISSIPGLLPVPIPIPTTSVNKVLSRKFVLPSDLLPNVAAASLSVQSSPGQFATPSSGFSPLTPNYPHGSVLSGVMMGSAYNNVSAVPVWNAMAKAKTIKSSALLKPQPSGNVEEATKLLLPSLRD